MSEQKYVASKPYTSLNPYFMIPFMVWVVLGGIAQLFFDRQVLFALVNTHHMPWLDTLMYYITKMGEGEVIAVVLLILLAVSSFRNWWFFLAAVFTNAIPNLITQAVKSAVNAPRPLNYFQEAMWIHTSPDWPRYMNRSFPSGHTTAAFCLFCFLAILLPKPYRVYGLVFFALAMLVAYSRIYLAAHFFIDVYFGSIIGSVFVIIIMVIMNRYGNSFFKESGS